MATATTAAGRAPRADKVAVVDEVRQRFAEADAVLFTEYRGLDVAEMADLRGRLIDADCRYKIYKNTLVRRALSADAPAGTLDLLLGPTALAFCGKDPSAAAQALRTFAAEHDALVIKGGVLAGTLLSDAQVRELADLPSRDELMAQMLGAFAAPLTALASMMNNLIGEVSGLLQALADKTPDSPAPAGETAAQTDRLDASAAAADSTPEAENAEADDPNSDTSDDPTNTENNQ
ncbi:50S ribosomal protein L10 [Candidatus Poriferisodalis sp.]|uniref:50S ribosomal protein L10 n=1 Tax=Candidatus Poriferisodalis sp. TaxID=3101277 RepID=UPI003B5C2774